MTGPENSDDFSGYRKPAEADSSRLQPDSVLSEFGGSRSLEDVTQFVHFAFDAMPAHIAVLDGEGRILAVNSAWRRFADARGMQGTNYGVGMKYLESLGVGHSELGEARQALARGIQQVLADQLEQFQMEYICGAAEREEWYRVRVNRLNDGGPARLVVAHQEITEVKRAQSALGISEQEYRILFANNPLPMWVFDEETLTFLAVNEAAIDHYQYSRQEFLAMTILEIRPPEELPRLAAQLAGKGLEILEARVWKHRKKDGTRIDVEVYSRCTEWAGRRARLVMAHDITERWRAAKALKTSEEQFSTVFHSSPDPICIATVRSDRVLDANESFLEITGYSREEVIGNSIANLKLWYSLEERKKVFAEFKKRGRVRNMEARLRTKSGEERLWLVSLELLNVGGQACILSVSKDVTNSKRAEAAKRESEERFRQLAENIADIFWLYDLETERVLYVNPAFERVLGHSTAELYRESRLWIESIHPDDREKADAEYQRGRQTGSINHEYRIVRPDGSIRYLRERGFGVRDEQGVIRRFAGIAEDITEPEQLEGLLRQAQKMEAVGQLAGGVAHDFSNLLTIIEGYCEQLERQPLANEATRSAVNEIHLAAKRASALTGQLLAFSRKQKLEPQVLDLNLLIAEVETILRRTLGENIGLVILLQQDLRPVKVDRFQFEQVVLNLAVNARDAMPLGGHLTITTSNVDLDEAFFRSHPGLTPGPCAVLAVQDTGEGMDARTREHIFEPFFTTKAAGKGTGLGLATVYGIVQQSGGSIEVESKPGAGSTFRIYLPAAREPVEVVSSG
jgi:PAS domain S-box-containing protein